MKYKDKYNKYESKYKNLGGGNYNNERICFISAHGEIKSPLELFKVPDNICIVPYARSGASAHFDVLETTIEGRKTFIRNAIKENLYFKDMMFPEMILDMNTEYKIGSSTPNCFGYTGIIESDYKEFSFKCENLKGKTMYQWHGDINVYSNSSNSAKTVAEKALGLNNKAILDFRYSGTYNLSQIICNISKHYENERLVYVFVSACRGIKLPDYKYGHYIIELFESGKTSVRGTEAHYITKELVEHLKKNVDTSKKDTIFNYIETKIGKPLFDNLMKFLSGLFGNYGNTRENKYNIKKFNIYGIIFIHKYIYLKNNLGKKLEENIKMGDLLIEDNLIKIISLVNIIDNELGFSTNTGKLETSVIQANMRDFFDISVVAPTN